MTLKERAMLGKIALAKQSPVTYEQKKALIEQLKTTSKEQNKKSRKS